MLIDELFTVTSSEKKAIIYLFKKKVLFENKIRTKFKAKMKVFRYRRKRAFNQILIFSKNFFTVKTLNTHRFLYLRKNATVEIVKMTAIQYEADTGQTTLERTIVKAQTYKISSWYEMAPLLQLIEPNWEKGNMVVGI